MHGCKFSLLTSQFTSDIMSIFVSVGHKSIEKVGLIFSLGLVWKERIELRSLYPLIIAQSNAVKLEEFKMCGLAPKLRSMSTMSTCPPLAASIKGVIPEISISNMNF